MPSSAELLLRKGTWSRKQRTPITRLVRGPTKAIWNSMPGLVGSRSILETPPKMNRVMLFTGNPRLRATSEWASSCKSTETNNSSDERKAIYPGQNEFSLQQT